MTIPMTQLTILLLTLTHTTALFRLFTHSLSCPVSTSIFRLFTHSLSLSLWCPVSTSISPSLLCFLSGLPLSDQYVKMEEERRQKDKDDKKKKEKKRKREKRGRGRQVDSGPESEEDITPAQQVDIMTEEMPEVGRPHMANGCFSIDFTHALKMIPALFPFRTLWLSVHSLVKMDQ